MVVMRSRTQAWILGGRRLAKRIVNDCCKCRVVRARLIKQRMGELPEERVKTGYTPFADVCLDLLGPTLVKSMVNKRAKMKVWPLLIICQATGGIHMEIMSNYSTQAFLLSWRHFTALWGRPGLVVSDKGSQLTSAGNVVARGEDPHPSKWKWEEIAEAGAKVGTRWEFVPAGCQYRNGRAERAIQVVKNTLKHMLRNRREKLKKVGKKIRGSLPISEIIVGVQRLVLIVAAENLSPEEGEEETTPSRPLLEAQGLVGSGSADSQVKQEDNDAETNSHPSHGPGSELPADTEAAEKAADEFTGGAESEPEEKV